MAGTQRNIQILILAIIRHGSRSPPNAEFGLFEMYQELTLGYNHCIAHLYVPLFLSTFPLSLPL